MGFLDTLTRNGHDTDSDTEQLAEGDPEPRGEDRESGGGFVFSRLRSRSGGDTIDVEPTAPPSDIQAQWDEFYPFPVVRAGLNIFADTVLEPGYKISAEVDGGTDEEMTEALELWAENCAIHGQQTNQDLLVLLKQIPKLRRGRGTEFMELVGAEGDPDALAALMLHKPWTFKQYSRQDQAILVQPDDDVPEGRPRTPDGDAAAYVQYDDALGFHDHESIPFAEPELVKFMYDADPGDAWGRSIFESIGPRIDSLRQKFDDRDIAIHQTGHPHRIYSSENWTLQDAKEYAKAHEAGETSAWEDDEDEGTFAGRLDFVSDDIEIKTEDGTVADISDAVKDDIEAIFSVLPVSKFKIAYEEDINQFVVEPQQEKDDRLVDEERRYLERKFTPIFEAKADELAGGDYGGEVSVTIEPDTEENPVKREAFPAENLQALGSFLDSYYRSGANQDFPPGFAAFLLGTDYEEIQEKYDWAPDELAPEDAPDREEMEGEAAEEQMSAIEAYEREREADSNE